MTESELCIGKESGDSRMDLPKLYSKKSTKRVEQVAALRARGVGDHIDLPQFVVCGDQSAGKSSVLEGISGIPFPRHDGVCTKFATEIILEQSEGPMRIVATILPGRECDDEKASKLRSFHRELERFEELPVLIVAAGTLMGVRGYADLDTGPAFGEDVLRIKVSGPTGLHLTVVDLPGLISVPNEEQTDADVNVVHALVDTYTQNPRTIILAVLQAGNDIANQPITLKSRKYDPEGRRTVGIITKPDLINKGTESRIALLAKNKDTTKLNLGFFLLKNPTPAELARGTTAEERQATELRFFKSPPWTDQGLDMTRVGILALRAYLQSLLDRHMEQELPKVREEIRHLLEKTENTLADLGEERTTTIHMRMYLSRISMRFHSLVVAALHGNYLETDGNFFVDHAITPCVRLRALIHRLNSTFSTGMRESGMKRKVTESSDCRNFNIEKEGTLSVSHTDMAKWVREVYVRTRGRELPGNYNHTLLSELFHEQAGKWLPTARQHLTTVYESVVEFIGLALRQVTSDDRLLLDLLEQIRTQLDGHWRVALLELEKLWEDEMQQPLTYNHYYTDNIQKSRKDTARDAICMALNEASVEDHSGWTQISNKRVDVPKLLGSLQKRITVNMEDQACSEASAGLTAYYKVARKTFVDNVCKQIVERHLLRKLPSVFSPEKVAGYDDEVLHRLASETSARIEERKKLSTLSRSLRSSLEDLRN